jgi:hypothetical protein
MDQTLHRTRFRFTTASGLRVHQRVRSFLKFFFETSNRTLHRTHPCRPPRPVPVTTTASGHPFQIFGLCQTGRCQRPIVDNRTRPVIPGPYWNVTGRCLHRVWSFDHRVRSSRKKRISPFLTVRLDLVSLVFPRPLSVLTVSPPPCHCRARRPRPRLRHRRCRAHACATARRPRPRLRHRRCRATAAAASSSTVAAAPTLAHASALATAPALACSSPEPRRRSRAAGDPPRPSFSSELSLCRARPSLKSSFFTKKP